MSKGINKVILIGYVGNDPEARPLPTGSVSNVRIATSEKWKDRQTGQPVEKTEWHKIVFYNQLSEIVNKYVKKGSKLYIEGSLRTNKWQDKDGKDQYTTEIVAKEIQLLDSRQDSGQESQTELPVHAKTNKAKKVEVEDDLPF